MTSKELYKELASKAPPNYEWICLQINKKLRMLDTLDKDYYKKYNTLQGVKEIIQSEKIKK
jgi:hypothetical protein